MAYGARLESVLGESPQGFESPILRVVVSGEIVHCRAGARDERRNPLLRELCRNTSKNDPHRVGKSFRHYELCVERYLNEVAQVGTPASAIRNKKGPTKPE